MSRVKQHWLVKTEPSSYSWETFVQEGRTAWTGVRNFQARNHLRAMRTGDPVLFYHSGATKEIVGLAKAVREAYPDPTAESGDWVAVDLAPVRELKRPVSLATIKGHAELQEMKLLRHSRLSVVPVSESEFSLVVELGSAG